MGSPNDLLSLVQLCRTLAKGARLVRDGELEAAERRLRMLSPQGQERVTRALERLAASPATADGVREALEVVAAEVPRLEGAYWAGSGQGPHRTVFKALAVLMLHGLIARAATDEDARGRIAEALENAAELNDLERGDLLAEAEG